MYIKYKFNKDKLWFTSDLHLYHKNITQYCNRPFLTRIEAMNDMLINRWNEVVKEDDDVIIAGDFIFTSSIELIKSTLERLNGRKWLVYGNHDYQNRLDRDSVKELFYNTSDALDFKVDDDEMEDGYTKFHITHYPCEFWTRGAIHLHGHVHSGPQSNASEKLTFKPMRYDIGVDNNNYYPISYENIKIIITKQLLGTK
jgi:calcineurin-like phosphoesterase family protein